MTENEMAKEAVDVALQRTFASLLLCVSHKQEDR
jgi:hypothetical protein